MPDLLAVIDKILKEIYILLIELIVDIHMQTS
jgi:hypothetical protein